MLQLRLFDSSLYYTLASVSECAPAGLSQSETEQHATGNDSKLELTGGDVGSLTALGGAVNLTFFTPAISHVMLAPTTMTTETRTTRATVSAAIVQTTMAPVHDLDAMSEAVLNATAGHSAELDNLNSFYFYETEQFAVLWILFTVIVLGNSAVLFVMFINKNRKSRMNYFIKQLALADLCVGLLNVLTDIIWRITISWRAGNLACKAIRFSQVCVTYSSTYVLVAMSIDRYDAITHPMNFSKSWKRARHLVAGAWLISAIFSLPILVLYEEKLIQGHPQCWIELGSPMAWQVYMSLVSVTLFAIPALIISACYAIIVKTIWAKGSIFVPTDRVGFGAAPARRASSRGIIPRAKVKTVKMTLTIVFVFIFCWSPYIIFDLLQVFGQIPHSQTNIAIATFIQSLAPLNSAANPLIYCLFSSQVFRTLSRFPPFKWFTCCCKSYRNNSQQNRCHTVGRRLHNSCDSMRTLTTSLTVSRRSTSKTNAHVVICQRPSKVITVPTMSEV
ncbi:cardioacceleratory peptide receptor [Drosophila guanche]|uniref:Blast:Cardioacceleratory peptide receptor n=1 Tax=Drosophila guanche TaxID=7266 RepID=A0A3B0KUT2_DROGU|nr:cardioacceleratory peptide receptor [Drosophila guanche]SPP89596.1 blast:Cardioacceleratory peptide receptor [Drosophila guanche]